MKIIVAHPGQQHSYKVASALKSNGLLFKYITAIYDQPDNVAMRLAHKIVRGNDSNKIGKRFNPDLRNDEVITFYTFFSLVVIVLSRFKFTKKFSFWLDRRIADAFGIKVAKYAIRNKVDAVVCFSMNEVTCFKYLKKKAPNIRRIVDYANTPVEHMVSIYEKDTCSELIKKEVPLFWNKAEAIKQKAGINNTEIFIAPSSFVAKGLIECGVSERKISIIPYGTNFDVIPKKKISDNKVIRFIYVGQVTFRKGVHHLLEAFVMINSRNISLDIVGEILPNSKIYLQYKDLNNVKFWGNVSHEKVRELMLEADVFLFPSLADSFSLAVLESMSCGLPVICSKFTGASDLIEQGNCGEIVDPFEIEEFAEKIRGLEVNTDKRIIYSNNSIYTATKYTWQFYSKNIGELFKRLEK